MKKNNVKEVIKLKVVEKPKRNISEYKYDKRYIDDFFDFYYESIENVIDIDNMSTTPSVLYSVYQLFIIKLVNSYEHMMLKDSNESHNSITKENDLFLSNIDNYIDNYKKSDHLSFFDNCELLELIALKKEKSNNKNIIELSVPRFDSDSQIDSIRGICINGLFEYITSYGLFLGTKKPTSSKIKNVNLELVKVYYDLYCNTYLLNELNDVINKRINIKDASSKIKLLYKFVPEDQIVILADICHHREFTLEAFLVSYIVASDINYYKTSDIEEHFTEDQLYELYDKGLDKYNEAVDELYLKFRFKNNNNK